MRLAPLFLTLVLAGCAADAGDPADESADESADELASTFTYRCSRLNKFDDGFDPTDYLRVSKSKVVWNKTNDFRASAGALTAKHDVDYRPKGSIAYVRYEYRDANAVHEWKLAPELVSGGMKMKGGDLGGFAVHGVTVDWYGSSKYVCLRTK